MSDAPEEIGLVGNGLEWRLWNRYEDRNEKYAVRYILRDKHEAELSALKKQVEEQTAEMDAATISGWKAAIDCASYAAANTYGPRVDPAAVAKARDDLVQELLTASPGDYLDCCWKDAQDAIRAEAEVAALRKALKEIAEGRGVCEKCGTLASGEGAGYTDCGCTYPTWAPLNPSAHARSALASTRETSDAG